MQRSNRPLLPEPEAEAALFDHSTAPDRLRRVSVVIANYNYDRFIGAAIDSALALDWPDVEVIVVDDGSTDSSAQIIAGYGDRVRTVYQQNATQRVARNRGYELVTGDAVIHLDSDDVLHPSLIWRAAAVWRAGLSKVQVQMERIDELGRPTGSLFPRFHVTPTPDDIRYWAGTTSAYPTPPGSGNVYSRAFLDRIFPIDDRCGPATDSACLAAAPFLGDVVTIAEPLVGYRVHNSNTSDMLTSMDTFARAIARARARHNFSLEIRGIGPVDDRPLFRSRPLLQLRVAARRMTPGHRPLPRDTWLRILLDAFATIRAPGPEPLFERVVITGWTLAVLCSPRSVAKLLIRLRWKRRR